MLNQYDYDAGRFCNNTFKHCGCAYTLYRKTNKKNSSIIYFLNKNMCQFKTFSNKIEFFKVYRKVTSLDLTIT